MIEEFPGWFYGPNDEAQMFEREKDVPAGWSNLPKGIKSSATPESEEVARLTQEMSDLRAELAEARKDARKAEAERAAEVAEEQQKREGDENNGTTDADNADDKPVWMPEKMTNEPTPETTGSPLPQSLMSPEVPNDPRKKSPGRPKKGV